MVLTFVFLVFLHQVSTFCERKKIPSDSPTSLSQNLLFIDFFDEWAQYGMGGSIYKR